MTGALRLAFGLMAALLLSACGKPDPDAPPPSPILYELASADGSVEGWLFGTIHALPDDTEWQTPAIERAVTEADLLVVEIANLEDRAGATALFNARAAAQGQPDILDRVSADIRPALAELIDRSGWSGEELRKVDTWAAALMLAQSLRHGDSANGIDRALLRQFRGREVVELEGLSAQFALFDTLPEQDQRDMLAALVTDHMRWQDDPGHLARAWLAGDIEQVIDPAQSALLADPELREALLTRRNAAWAPRIAAMLDDGPKVLVAVGAGHLPGPDGLAALLEARGFTVRALR
ncbi:MAG: hypothetical protein B7X57_09820 [Erythrobacter sp. 34-65-8]|nr:MAG: hypothetical protein B7X57_09820 [Erythrobacter sp. 34-65-8]